MKIIIKIANFYRKIRWNAQHYVITQENYFAPRVVDFQIRKSICLKTIAFSLACLPESDLSPPLRKSERDQPVSIVTRVLAAWKQKPRWDIKTAQAGAFAFHRNLIDTLTQENFPTLSKPALAPAHLPSNFSRRSASHLINIISPILYPPAKMCTPRSLSPPFTLSYLHFTFHLSFFLSRARSLFRSFHLHQLVNICSFVQCPSKRYTRSRISSTITYIHPSCWTRIVQD